MTCSALARAVSRFRRASDGGVTVEAALVMPMLVAILVSTFVFHDLFSFRNVRQKATFTVADMISRETDPVSATYLDTALTLFNTITFGETNNTLRVSLVSFEADTGRYGIDWSEVRGSALAPLTDADVALAHDTLPTMTDEERLILVESTATYRPPFNVGIGETEIVSRAFLRPRFAPQVLYSGS